MKLKSCCIAACMAAALLVMSAGVPGGHAEAAPVLSVSQQLAVYSPSGWAMVGQWNFNSLTWEYASGGGYGYFWADMGLWFGGWYGMVVQDLSTGNYTEILYTLDAMIP